MRFITLFALAAMPTIAFAQETSAAPAGSPFASLMPLLLIFVVFYFFLIRPQQKRMRQHQSMIEALKKGDQVITGGGVLGKVVKVEDDKVVVEIANGIEVTVVKATLQQAVAKPEAIKPAHQEKKKSEKNDNRLPSKEQIANDN